MSIVFDDVEWTQQQAREDWLFQNAQSHRVIDDELRRLGLETDDLPLGTIGNLRDWMKIHNDRHIQEASLAAAPTPPDLEEWDLDDENQLRDFLIAHALAHTQLNIALGL